MRPSRFFIYILLAITAADLAMVLAVRGDMRTAAAEHKELAVVVASLGLTDLCIATEARYTRHPALTDYVVPFMDYPGEMEHFPTGSFWIPQPLTGRK